MLPLGAFWPAPEDEDWIRVERSHGILRSAKDIEHNQYRDDQKQKVTGFIIPVISWIIQECAVSSWTILTGMITGMI